MKLYIRKRCPRCNGNSWSGGQCHYCGGLGWEHCPECGGDGYIEEEEEDYE